MDSCSEHGHSISFVNAHSSKPQGRGRVKTAPPSPTEWCRPWLPLRSLDNPKEKFVGTHLASARWLLIRGSGSAAVVV